MPDATGFYIGMDADHAAARFPKIVGESVLEEAANLRHEVRVVQGRHWGFGRPRNRNSGHSLAPSGARIATRENAWPVGRAP